ncbi:unnamed protein product [Amoebophrya sp. A120]|nr:unnamed protein product [Amoebophrya sp. A120]|eukprot:GSA120T00001364001.1
MIEILTMQNARNAYNVSVSFILFSCMQVLHFYLKIKNKIFNIFMMLYQGREAARRAGDGVVEHEKTKRLIRIRNLLGRTIVKEIDTRTTKTVADLCSWDIVAEFFDEDQLLPPVHRLQWIVVRLVDEDDKNAEKDDEEAASEFSDDNMSTCSGITGTRSRSVSNDDAASEVDEQHLDHAGGQNNGTEDGGTTTLVGQQHQAKDHGPHQDEQGFLPPTGRIADHDLDHVVFQFVVDNKTHVLELQRKRTTESGEFEETRRAYFKRTANLLSSCTLLEARSFLYDQSYLDLLEAFEEYYGMKQPTKNRIRFLSTKAKSFAGHAPWALFFMTHAEMLARNPNIVLPRPTPAPLLADAGDDDAVAGRTGRLHHGETTADPRPVMLGEVEDDVAGVRLAPHHLRRAKKLLDFFPTSNSKLLFYTGHNHILYAILELPASELAKHNNAWVDHMKRKSESETRSSTLLSTSSCCSNLRLFSATSRWECARRVVELFLAEFARCKVLDDVVSNSNTTTTTRHRDLRVDVEQDGILNEEEQQVQEQQLQLEELSDPDSEDEDEAARRRTRDEMLQNGDIVRAPGAARILFRNGFLPAPREERLAALQLQRRRQRRDENNVPAILNNVDHNILIGPPGRGPEDRDRDEHIADLLRDLPARNVLLGVVLPFCSLHVNTNFSPARDFAHLVFWTFRRVEGVPGRFSRTTAPTGCLKALLSWMEAKGLTAVFFRELGTCILQAIRLPAAPHDDLPTALKNEHGSSPRRSTSAHKINSSTTSNEPALFLTKNDVVAGAPAAVSSTSQTGAGGTFSVSTEDDKNYTAVTEEDYRKAIELFVLRSFCAEAQLLAFAGFKAISFVTEAEKIMGEDVCFRPEIKEAVEVKELMDPLLVFRGILLSAQQKIEAGTSEETVFRRAGVEALIEKLQSGGLVKATWEDLGQLFYDPSKSAVPKYFQVLFGESEGARL